LCPAPEEIWLKRYLMVFDDTLPLNEGSYEEAVVPAALTREDIKGWWGL